LPIFYNVIARLPHVVMVHEEMLRQRLERMSHRKVAVIPHGCRNADVTISPMERERLRASFGFERDEIVLLCFGFVAHYKGSDWILGEMAAHARVCPGSKLRLILAGGESPSMCGRNYYQRYYAQLQQQSLANAPYTRITGYVPSELVASYFLIADFAVFPYRTHMSASGPFALAVSFGVACLFSEPLQSVAFNEDFVECLEDSRLTREDICFPLKPGSLVAKVGSLAGDPERLRRLSALSRSLAARRCWGSVARAYVRQMKLNPIAQPVVFPEPVLFAEGGKHK
jgi:glycosyltransferase involved in cell wall biosynthesis